MYCRNKIILFIIFCTLCFYGIAQDTTADYKRGKAQQQSYLEQPVTPNTFDKEDWKTLKKKLKIKDYKPEKEEPKLSNDKKGKPWSKSLSPQTVKIIQWIVFGILFLALVYLILRVIGINPFNKSIDKNKINIALDELEENLDTAAIDPHLYEAIKSKNFKLAIRLYYLMIIQKLALKEKIIWKKYKTNKHYLNEMRDKDEYPVLKNLTLTYERCWFGEEDITEAQYNTINSGFVNFLQNIK